MIRRAQLAILALAALACGACSFAAQGARGAKALSPAERAYLVDGDADRAEDLLAAALEESPADAAAEFLLADLLDATGRPAEAAEHYLRVVARGREDSSLGDVSTAAAMAIVAIRDRVSGFRDRFAAAAGSLDDPGWLPQEAAFELRNLAFGLALRLENDAASRAAARDATGCLTRWEISGPYGPAAFDALDRAREQLPHFGTAAPWPIESRLGPGRGLSAARVEEASRCTIAAFDPAVPEPGLGLARTVVALPRADTVLFRLESDASARVYAGNVEIFSFDRRGAWPPRYRWFAAALPAGNTEIAVAIAHPEVRPVFSLVAVRAANGAPVPSHGPGLLPSGAAAAAIPLPEEPDARTATAALARLRAAIWRSDGAATARETAALERLGAAGSWPMLAAAAEAALASSEQPLDAAFESSRRLLSRALALEPRLWSARLAVARAEAADGRPEVAYGLLREGRALNPDEPSVAERLADLCLEIGYAVEAAEAARELGTLVAGSCPARAYALAAARGAVDGSRLLEMAADLAACDRTSDALANALLDAQRYDEAQVELRRLLDRDPESPALIDASARAALAAGDLDGFVGGMRRLFALRPFSQERRRALADALAGAGRVGEAHALIAGGRAADAAAFEGADLHTALRVDGLAAITAFRAARPIYGTGSAWVLDRAVHVIGRDGSRTEIVHNIAAILTAGAVAEHGEVEVPDDATILTARAVKPDGTVRTPERIPGKASLSLPDLAAGDFVEVEYTRWSPPSPVFLGGFDTGRFYFRDFDHVFRRSEIVVVAPLATPLEIDPRGDAPAAAERIFGDLRVLTFRARDVAPAVEEPLAPHAAELLPSIRVTSGASVEAICARVRDLLADRERGTPAIDAVAARAVEGIDEADRGKRLAALYAWTMANVAEDGELADPASHILSRRRGSRARAFLALARAAGLDGRLAFVRSAHADDTRADGTSLDRLERVAVSVDGRWASFETDAAPFGYLPPDLRHRPALFPDRCETATTDGGAIPVDRRVVEVALEIGPGGEATARVSETVSGEIAAAWRAELRAATDEERARLFSAEHVTDVAPGATLVRLAFAGLDDDDGPLEAAYELAFPSFARRVSGSLRGELPFSRSLARELGGPRARSAPAVLATYLDESISITVTPPDGLAVRTDDDDGSAAAPCGSATRRITAGAGPLNVRHELRLNAGRIAPADYPALVDFAAASDDLSTVGFELADAAQPRG